MGGKKEEKKKGKKMKRDLKEHTQQQKTHCVINERQGQFAARALLVVCLFRK